VQRLLNLPRLPVILVIVGLFWLLVTVVAIVNDRGFLAMWRMQYVTVQLAQDVQKIESENRNLLHEAQSLRSDMRAIERIAREELGLVRPGELVFELVK
jgi:cell division protein FtsB